MQPWERLSCHNQLLLVFKPTLLKPFGIKSTLVPLRNERQLKSFGISEDKKELVWSKLQKNLFLPIATPFTAQEIWMFDENIEKKNAATAMDGAISTSIQWSKLQPCCAVLKVWLIPKLAPRESICRSHAARREDAS